METTKVEHRFDIGDRVQVSEAFPLPGYGLAKVHDVVATVEELRTGEGGAVGYVVHWWGTDGPFASHRYAVAFDRHCELAGGPAVPSEAGA